MSFYSSPTYHFGNLNPVFNATDYEPQNTTTLTEATADERYLKLSGGICTGSLTAPSLSLTTSLSVPTATVSTSLSVPTATVSSSLTVPAITLSSNSISQTVGQIGYIYSTSVSATVSSSGTLTNIASISSLPIGVYIISYGLSFNSNTSSGCILQKYVLAFSTSSSSNSTANLINSNLSTGQSINQTTTFYQSSPFIYQQSSSSNLYFNATLNYSGVSTGIVVGGTIQALRIA
jgi:hypothetical protein